VDRQPARTCPGGGDPGGDGPAEGVSTHLPTAARGSTPGRRPRRGVAAGGRVVAALALVTVTLFLGRAGPALASPSGTAGVVRAAPAPGLVLLSQTPWVTPGQAFDLHLRTSTSVPASRLGLTVSVYACLSSVSGFDQSVGAGPSGTPASSTPSPVAVSGLPTLPGGGVDLSLPVVLGASGTGAPSAGAPFTIHLLPVVGQCQSFPAGVFPVRIQLVDTPGGSVLGSFTTHLVYTEATSTTQRLRVSVVLPVHLTQQATPAPTPPALLARPGAALTTPPASAVAAEAGTVSAIAAHPTVPLTLQVSGQTVGLLDGTSHGSTVVQLGQLAATPDVHQLTSAPFTPVDAAALVGAGLSSELALQVSRGLEAVDGAIGRPVPVTGGLGPWVTGNALDTATVAALAGDGFRQVVLPASDLTSAPSDGSATQPFLLAGAHGTGVTAMASDTDLTARFTSSPGDPVLAAHQLVAELAQLYYERPNAVSPRAVLAVAPASWVGDPHFVDALLGALDGNPVVQPVTTSQAFALFPTPSACRTACRLTGAAGAGPPAAAIRTERARINGFGGATIGARTLTQQLGDLVLGAEAEDLRPPQQAAVAANAGLALDAQLGQLAVEGDQTVTLTASSGPVPVTVYSDAGYPVTATLVLSSDKLLFPNGETQWSTPVLLPPRHSTVVSVRVRTRTSGVFRLDVVLRSPDDTLRLVTGQLSVRSTSSSLVGIVLTVGAIAVLAIWWVRTSLRRRRARRAEESDDGSGDTPTGAAARGTGSAPGP